ncbi:hypothetical protein HEP74_00050 [Xanthomonas sp. SS]|uniref:hypothetical protein n=1 Tax=Xanthomonas sp. SS TaxID=2724122 RepID=UPI001639D47E|nr:hypothetical protein [Xanthomonas sp. SS]QNH14937.1 hypothetical protein HEP74_00050 [Xanthomonas sp. SS]
METAAMRLVFEKALEVMVKSTPIIGPVAGVLIESARDTEAASQGNDIAALVNEAKRQELSLHMAKMQAQVAQELAIAHRIENAVEVEIEEYYEGSGKGGLSGAANAEGGSVFLGGEGRKVVKRVYRFTGATGAASPSNKGDGGN